ncbi:MAG: hypothetical protein QM479_15270 [Pseudomonadota bacterium]
MLANKFIFLVLLFIGFIPKGFTGDWTDTFRYNGFLTQGFIKSSDNSFFGDSTNGSFEFTEVAINASVKPIPKLLLSAQIMMRNAGNMYDPKPAIDYLLADYNLINTTDTDISIAVGRIKIPFGFFNDTRDVAFTRPSIFLPQVIYYDQLRNPFLSNDGIMFNSNFNNDIGNFKLQLLYGYTLEDKNLEVVYLGNDWGGEINNGNRAYSGRLLYETNNQNFRAAFSILGFDLDFDASPTDPIGNGSVKVLYYAASLEYTAENWWLTGEYGWEPVEYKDFDSIIPDSKNTLEGYYLQANYRLIPKLSMHLRYERGYLNNKDKYGTKQEAYTGKPSFRAYAIGWSTGIRWDIDDNWLLMMDYQWIEGTYYLSPADNPNPDNFIKNWHMLNMLISFRF